jgi:hypothetical protein
MPLTTAQRVLYGRVGAAIARSRHDPKELTAEARKRFLARFEAQVREEYPDLPDAEIQRRAAELRKAHMLGLSVRSSIARSKKRTASVAHTETALEVRDATATPPTRAA